MNHDDNLRHLQERTDEREKEKEKDSVIRLLCFAVDNLFD